MRTGFSHSLVLYQKSHSFAALTRSFSDTSPTRVKIPYARAFHEVISIYYMEEWHMSRFPPFAFVELISPYNKKNITRWLEDMNFVFSWQEQYLTIVLATRTYLFATV